MHSLTRASWRFFTRHPWQLWLTLLSIALGAAIIIAVDLANQSAGQSFARSANALAGEMTHEIIAQTEQNGVSDDFYRQLRIDWGYRNSAPQVSIALNKAGIGYTLLGLDPFALSMQLQWGEAVELPADTLTRLMTETRSVILSTELAQRWKVQSGDQVLLTYEGEPLHFTVIATADFPAVATDIVFTDIATAQSLAPEAGLSRIQLKLEGEQAVLLAERLPATLKLESFAARQQVFVQMTASFSTNLLAMSLLAMLVGAFLVYNTMTFSVLQRRQTFAILRMLGFTGQQLFRSLLYEALILGLLGSVLGVLLGIFLGQGLLILVSQTMDDLFVSVGRGDLQIMPLSLLKGVGITLLAVIVATLAPAWEAARVQPVSVQRRSTLEQSSQHLAVGLAVAGVVLILLSRWLPDLASRSLSLGFISLFVLILGYSLCVPWILQHVLAGLHYLTRHRPLVWRMTVRGVQSSLSRTSLAIIALAVAVSATVGVSVMVGSFRHSVADWLAMTLSSDLYVSATALDSEKIAGSLHENWLTRINELPAVESVSSGRTAALDVEGQRVSALVLEPGPHSGKGFEYLSGDSALIWPEYLAGNGVLVSEPFAYHRGKQAGDSIAVMTELAGVVEMRILGVFRDYSSTQGLISMPRSLYERYWADRSRSSIGIKLKTEAHLDTVRRQLEGLAAELQQPGHSVLINSNKVIRDKSLQIFDRTFAITHVLRLLVVMVAFVGVFSALMALFLEKGREFSILRATGFTPQQLRYLVSGQTALIGLLAGLLALPLGWLMSDILIDLINRRSFGWTMQRYFFAWTPVQAVLLALIAALLAGVYPVWRMSGMQLRESLAER